MTNPVDYGQQLPVQLLQILTKINENISEVKERVIRLEAQDYQYALREVKECQLKESEKRRELEDKVFGLENKHSELKTRIAPMLAGGSVVFTIVLNMVFRAIHFQPF